MRIILTGATGFVGSEILRQLLQRGDIEAVTCISRRPLQVQSLKLRVLLHADFSLYPAALAQDLANHDALLWAIGGRASADGDAAAYERLTCTATIACATAIAHHLPHPFRFGYLSGMGANPTETARFPWHKPTRHLQGRTEHALQTLSEAGSGFQATCFRPARILPRSAGSWVNALLAPIAIRVDHLAHAMIEESTRNIAERFSVLDNATLRKIADPSH